ncbi:Dual specificity protein phosphatase 16 [Sparganum proliferum]
MSRPSLGSLDCLNKARVRRRPATLAFCPSSSKDTVLAPFSSLSPSPSSASSSSKLSKGPARSPIVLPSWNDKQSLHPLSPLRKRLSGLPTTGSMSSGSSSSTYASEVRRAVRSSVFRAYHYQKIHRLTSEQVSSSSSSRCTSPGPGASQYEDAFKPAATPVARPNPFRQSTRDPLLPYGQHSAFKPTDGESVPPTRILPHLVIGSQADAMSAETCRQFGITHVINVSADGPASPHIPLENFFRIPIQDNFTDQITPFFDRAFMMINSARASQGCILIHCAAGISRSPTVAIAYLMQTSKLTLEAAYNSGGLSVKMSKSASSPMIARRVKIEGVFLTAAAPVMGSLCRSSVLPMPEFPRQTLLAGGESYCRQEESCHLSTSSSLSSVQ